MTIAEGGGRRAISRKFQDVFFPALKASFMVWPLVQILNFRVIPLPFQIVRPPKSSIFPCGSLMLPFFHSDTLLTRDEISTAIHVDRRYCMDRLPLPHQLRRRASPMKTAKENRNMPGGI